MWNCFLRKWDWKWLIENSKNKEELRMELLFADHSESVMDELLARHRKWPWTRHSDVEQFLMKWDWRWLIGTSKNKEELRMELLFADSL